MKTSNKIIWSIIILLIVGLSFYLFFSPQSDQNQNGLTPDLAGHIQSKSDLIVLEEPKPMATVSSPLIIHGQARGAWYFEASFPVTILDGNGNVLVRTFASAVLDPNDPNSTWMTEDFVPFESEISFDRPTTNSGTLVLEKDNPSGLPEHDDELRIPINFNLEARDERTISLYYYNPDMDVDNSGNILCSEKGLVSVERMIPITQTPIQDTINLLLQGNLTNQEKAQGITTEYPLDGFQLEGASLNNGTLTLGFSDPNNRTSGGSCRASILWLQIRETALQFEEVQNVQFQSEELFQP
ncbi:MAG: hypothetical protein CO183_00890 [Candidatus Zambryskibacteria bacterium CG_4_9_14_3_um_filter_42_9]|uniref:Bacterial spore germination immunoglobulin-like domain-containing protein n=1 Tax=Candidatus Zambryskibacteria bacterium CG22_combo_CG10-13_8_21_14_all_42_17 TaxID=1975118 RepID=A0A2H0BD02_9BACT|nr:MAG: hypothetical protein COX06_02795 [Candidatus Zambryskibacteria bacterium CG22_combo_CG10-13_8_21_14_all_42_17]PJA36940.1 MAG: hypothetical protein CO183_00890 [Candidatus Zambryskibacteria bacterium CG_4_9_14_3_um_filter_42_9]